MPSKTYKVRVLVLRKTKLGDKDLVVTMLNDQGELVRGVAKGARKPGGTFAARLELFCVSDVLMAQGRSLDVVCDAKLVNPGSGVAWSLEKSSCAAPIAELICQVAQPDLSQPRVFDMASAAFNSLGDPGLDEVHAVAVCAATLWKVMSQVGFRPSFSSCVMCGNDASVADGSPSVPVSVLDGGVVCSSCQRPADAVMVERRIVQWCEALILMRFSDIAECDIDMSTCLDVLHLGRMWVRAHTGRDLKSLNFLLTSGLFESVD